jgi:undecaprenyl-diphosphatase
LCKGERNAHTNQKEKIMTLTWIQTLVLALLQGVTELFPISSLGHTVVIPGLLGWTALVQSPQFLPIIVAFHLGTSAALVLYFWRDWLHVGRTLLQSVQQGEVKQGDASWVSWLVIIGCIPAGLLGVLLQKPIENLFSSPLIAAAGLVVNGSLLMLGESLRYSGFSLASLRPQVSVGSSENRWSQLGLPPERRAALGLAPRPMIAQATVATESWPPVQSRQETSPSTSRPLTELSWKEAILIGLAQALALFPGISRSGATMAACLAVGLSHDDAAHYTFLLGTPLIAAAALLEIPKLIGASGMTLVLVVVGMVLSGLAAYLSTKFLMRYFETGRLHPFAYYCWALGGISLVLFLLGVGVR